MTDYLASLIRTYVPVGVGAALAWIASRTGVVIDESTAAGGVAFFGAVLTGLYYAAVRALEARFPAVGFLLGVAKPPVYPEPYVPPAPPIVDQPFDPEGPHGVNDERR